MILPTREAGKIGVGVAVGSGGSSFIGMKTRVGVGRGVRVGVAAGVFVGLGVGIGVKVAMISPPGGVVGVPVVKATTVASAARYSAVAALAGDAVAVTMSGFGV